MQHAERRGMHGQLQSASARWRPRYVQSAHSIHDSTDRIFLSQENRPVHLPDIRISFAFFLLLIFCVFYHGIFHILLISWLSKKVCIGVRVWTSA